MMSEEGAVKNSADVSPADSEDEWRDDPAADFGDPSFEPTGPENVGMGDSEAHDGRETFIPRDRFDQVNSRAQQLERELLLHRERSELAHRALAAGYRDVGQFAHDDAWAKANHYEGIEQFLQTSSNRNQLSRQLGRGDVNDSVRADLMRDKHERLRTQQELQQVRGLLQSVQRSTLDQTIASARAHFDHVDPGDWAQIERLCRDIGRPDAVQRVISTFAPVMQSARKSAAQQAVIDHNARRASNGAGALSPEGRGGGKAPSPLPKVSPQQAKNRLLSDLLGFRK